MGKGILMGGGGGVDLDFVTAGADQILNPFVGADVDGEQVVGNIFEISFPTSLATSASGSKIADLTPITEDSYINIPKGHNAVPKYYRLLAIQTEIKTATGNGDVTPSSGKYLEKVTVSIPTQSGKTVTPGTSVQTAVASGKLTTGDVKVAGDANLVAANIVNGKSIFGVSGNARKFASLNGNDYTGQKAFTSFGTKYYKRITGHGFTPAFGGTYPTSDVVMITGSNYITISDWYPISGDWNSSAIDMPFNGYVTQGSAIWKVVGYY